jgi:rhamnogalacturonan endolyase
MGDLVYEPPRDGPTLWEIGIPDRSAEEFYVPDPNPKYINKLYVNHPDRLVMLVCEKQSVLMRLIFATTFFHLPCARA